MIRTNVVELTTVKGVAYRLKLPSGGSGIVILLEGAAQPGIASISKTSGEAIPSENTSKKLYPKKAFKEAMELTAGLPYKKQGKVKLKGRSLPEAPAEKDQKEEVVVVDSAEYGKLVDKYTDKSGKLSYDLLNKDMIKFAHSSSIARKMIGEGKSLEDIRLYAAGSKFRSITGNAKLTDAQILKMVELLDEVSPKGVFKAFNDELRKLKSANKK